MERGGLSPLPGPCAHGCQRQLGTPDVLDPPSSSSGTESSLREGDSQEREALRMSVMKIKKKIQLKWIFSLLWQWKEPEENTTLQ